MPLPDLTYEEAVCESHCPRCNGAAPDGLMFCSVVCLYEFVHENGDLFAIEQSNREEIANQVVDALMKLVAEDKIAEALAMMEDINAQAEIYAHDMKEANDTFEGMLKEIAPFVLKALIKGSSGLSDEWFNEIQGRLEQELFHMREVRTAMQDKFKEYGIG